MDVYKATEQAYKNGYKAGAKDSIVEFVEFLKQKSFLCDANDWHSFQAINVEDDLDDLAEEFLNEAKYEF